MKSYWYKKDLTRKRLDKWMRSTLLKAIATSTDFSLELSRDATTTLESRKGELSLETLRVVTMSRKYALINPLRNVLSVDMWRSLLQGVDEHYESRNILNLITSPNLNAVTQALIPELIELLHREDADNIFWSGTRLTLLTYPEVWEAGRHMPVLAQHMIQHKDCGHELWLELVTRFPELMHQACYHNKFEEFFTEGKLQIVRGPKYEAGEEPAAELQRTGDSV